MPIPYVNVFRVCTQPLKYEMHETDDTGKSAQRLPSVDAVKVGEVGRVSVVALNIDIRLGADRESPFGDFTSLEALASQVAATYDDEQYESMDVYSVPDMRVPGAPWLTIQKYGLELRNHLVDAVGDNARSLSADEQKRFISHLERELETIVADCRATG